MNANARSGEQESRSGESNRLPSNVPCGLKWLFVLVPALGASKFSFL